LFFITGLFLTTALQEIKLENSEPKRPQVLQMLENICMKFLELQTEHWQCMAGQQRSYNVVIVASTHTFIGR